MQAFYYALFYLTLLFPALKGHQKSTHASGLKDLYAQYSAMKSRDLSPVFSPSSGGTRENPTRPMSGTGPEHFILCNAIPSSVENFKFKTLMRRIKEIELADYKLASVSYPYAKCCRKDYIPAKQVANPREKTNLLRVRRD